MVCAERELAEAGISERPGVVLADAAYWSNAHIDRLRERGITPLVAADADGRAGPRKTRLGGPYDFMRRVLKDGAGADLYSRRQAMVEPVFAHIKQNRRAGRLKRRGRAAVRSAWRLVTETHNLLKLHRHTSAAAEAWAGPKAPAVFRMAAGFAADRLAFGRGLCDSLRAERMSSVERAAL